MKCPYCQQIVAEAWFPTFVVSAPNGEKLGEPSASISYLVNDDEEDAAEFICAVAGIPVPEHKTGGKGVGLMVTTRWMRCPNSKCRQLLVHVRRRLYDPFYRSGSITEIGVEDLFSEEAIVFPRRPAPRPLDSNVPAKFANPFQEACLILDDSPGMSAVLARKVLADLLDDVAGLHGYTVNEQINKFINDPNRPTSLKENLHYLREMADFAAHTKTDVTTGEILNTSKEEAEWTLTVIESLFDNLIIGPARDEARRQQMAAKMQQANRKPIPPLTQGDKP